MSAKILYETEYKKSGHFSFGQNWRDFLSSVTPERIKIAQESLETFLGKNSVKSKTFIDVGCGSGIFSLAAHRLKAAKVVSLDVDEASVTCVRYLREQEANPKHWEVKEGSALNTSLLKQFGQFDIVYSWGVLHHTGDMHTAIKNVAGLVKPDGKLFISIYNHSKGLKHGISTFWLKAKRHYNQSHALIKRLYVGLYTTYLFLGLAVSGNNPFQYIREYKSARGMSWKHDIYDWLGGYPYEFAEPSAVVSYLSDLGFTLKKSQIVSTIGCNEYVFVRNQPVATLPAVTVLLSVHNNAQTLDKALATVFSQTLQPEVVCINDASTDKTAEVLSAWQEKMGKKLRVLVNEKNLGLTKSLNKGLKQIETPYTARIDADDWWEPTKLEKQINFLESNPDYGIIGCWYTNHRFRKTSQHRPPMTDAAIRKAILHLNPFAHSSVVFRTDLIRNLGGYNETVKYGQDYELWLRLLPKTKFFNFPQNLCHRLFTGGISIERQRDQMRYAMQTRIKYIRQNRLPIVAYTSIIEPWIVSIAPRWLANIKRKLSDR